MTHRGYVMRTYEKNAVCDGYTSSFPLKDKASPVLQGEKMKFLAPCALPLDEFAFLWYTVTQKPRERNAP